MENFIQLLVRFLTALLAIVFSGCASTNKGTEGSIKFKADELVSFIDNAIVDPSLNYRWEYLEDNPTTYYRLKLANSSSLENLPTVDELFTLLNKISFQIDNKKLSERLSGNSWFTQDCDFLASTSKKTNTGEVQYDVVQWNSGKRSSAKKTVIGGDLVYVLLLFKF